MCKQRGCNSFIKHAIPYAFKNAKTKKLHIYGANFNSIPYIHKIEKMYRKTVSVDNRKWEYYKPSNERLFWFTEYIKKIEPYLN